MTNIVFINHLNLPKFQIQNDEHKIAIIYNFLFFIL